jgi:hypothetical protein
MSVRDIVLQVGFLMAAGGGLVAAWALVSGEFRRPHLPDEDA